MSELILSSDQQNAYEAFSQFIIDPTDDVFVLQGYSGTGKSTLVEKLIDDLPRLLKAVKLIDPDENARWDISLTATTNKAADNLAQITGHEVVTIHSKLGLRVHQDFKTGKTSLKVKRGTDELQRTVLFIDEASYIDHDLLQWIFKLTHRCKIVFIGDPAQLLNVGCKRSPVFDAGFTTARLEKVVRQSDGSPITDLATAFRGTVNTGKFFSFVPDGTAVKYLPSDEFEQAIADEFTRKDWKHNDSKVLAWTNRRVIEFNHGIRNLVSGDPDFTIGDYAVCNSFISIPKVGSVKTDQLVLITNMIPATEFGIPGVVYELDRGIKAFMPNCRDTWKKSIKEAQEMDDLKAVRVMSNEWIDLRAAYACTINKSQGSTYDKVFIDLNDVKKCRNGNQLARMLYVGVSRARHEVILTGDLI